MKHFLLKIILTVLLAAGFVLAFSYIVTWQNYRILSRDAAEEKQINRDAVNYTLKNLTAAWNDYEIKIKGRYEMEAVLSALALQSVIDDDKAVEDETGEDSALAHIADGKLSIPGSIGETLGLEESLFTEKSGSFVAPNEPSTLVVYCRIGNTDKYYVEWHEDVVLDDLVLETIDIPGILKRTEIAYDVSAMFLPGEQDGRTPSELLYRNDRYFSDCEKIGDLGLTLEDLQGSDQKASGTLTYDDISFSYVAGESLLPAGYVILLDPVPNLYAKAFGQAGYMIAALIVLLAALLTAGFSLYLYVRDNILTPDQEKTYQPAHSRSLATLFGILGLIIIALTGMLIYALNGLYDDVARGRERLATMDESIYMYTDRFGQNIQSFDDIYLEFGNHIAEFLDTYPELRDPEVLATLADSIHASSITLYGADGRETVSSGPWIDLTLGTDPDSSTYEFRKILKGAPYIIHDQETDEETGLNEMKIGIRIRDDVSEEKYGIMLLGVDASSLSEQDANPEKAVREILQDLSDDKTTMWIADVKSGLILVSADQEMEGKSITETGLSESDLKGSLVKTVKTEEGSSFVTSASMATSGILEWTNAKEGIIAYYRGPKTPYLSGMLGLVLTGCILFAVIYLILAWIVLKGYTEEFFQANKHVKGSDIYRKNQNQLMRSLAEVPPGRKGIAAMEIATAVFLLQMMPFIDSGSLFVKNTVYYFISSGDWEKGFNLFAIAAILILLSKVVLLVIGVRLVLSICGSFAGAKGKTIFRLLASVFLYIALFFFLIQTFEYLGFSATAIAAGLGSLALAISLGAQNFVADIFAGLTFVFEGTIHVGDNVQIAVVGSPVVHGTVMEIGVRNTRVLTQEGDLISCGNRDIKMIKNSTRMNTRVICELVVSSDLSADEIERMLNEELPKVGQEDRRILAGPFYNGITALGSGTMTLSVSAECTEKDNDYVRDVLNASLQRIFREHGYSI